MEKDTYRTISKPSEEVLFKDRNSKFFGYAFPIVREEQVKAHIGSLKKQHQNAGHWCYAYQLGTEIISYRANDDGEPNNSAGMPIYGQIQSLDITNALVVVVRYFGGTKLGVSGLINAYRTTARMALENSSIVEKTLNKQIMVSCTYDHINKVMRIIKENNLNVINQEMQLDCKLTIEVRLKDVELIISKLSYLHNVTIKLMP